jgi:Trk K+ transport system NAD-binding subunit
MDSTQSCLDWDVLGFTFSRELTKRGQRVLGVDFDPDVVHRLRESEHSVVYGDAEDPEFASTLPLSSARWVVSSVPQLSVNLALLHALSRYGYNGSIAATAHNDRDAAKLREAGSSLILLPFADAAKEAIDELIQLSPSSIEGP